MRAYLRAHQLELRITLNARTVEMLLDKAGVPTTNAAAPDGFEAARAAVARQAAGWFPVRLDHHALVAQQTNVTRGVEDHIEIVLQYRRPPGGVLAFDAAHLRELPLEEPYGADVTVVDLANNVVLGQKALTAAEHVFEVDVSRVEPPLRPATGASQTKP